MVTLEFQGLLVAGLIVPLIATVWFYLSNRKSKKIVRHVDLKRVHAQSFSSSKYGVPETPFSIQEFSALMHEYYNALIAVGYVSRKDIEFPPHSINTTLCSELKIDPTVIRVMEHIPFPCTDESSQDSPIVHDSRALVFTDEGHLVISRDPANGDWAPGKRRLDYLSPWELPLTIKIEASGRILLLSVRENTIRTLDAAVPDTKLKNRHGISAPRPDEPSHYLNILPRPANEVIRDLIKEVRMLDVIPIADGHKGSFVGRDQHPQWRILVDKMVEMGYPDEFQVEEWREIVPDFWQGIMNL